MGNGNPNWKAGGPSPNPGGRPRILHEVRTLAREYTVPAIQALAEVLANPKSPPAAKCQAANSLLDRGWGRAEQSVTARVETTRINLDVLTIEERTELDRLSAQFGLIAAKPGFLLEDGSDGSPAAA